MAGTGNPNEPEDDEARGVAYLPLTGYQCRHFTAVSILPTQEPTLQVDAAQLVENASEEALSQAPRARIYPMMTWTRHSERTTATRGSADQIRKGPA